MPNDLAVGNLINNLSVPVARLDNTNDEFTIPEH